MREDILDDGLHLPKADSIENAKEILKLKADHAELHTKIRHGRNAIYWLIGITVLGFIIEGAQTNFELLVVGIYAAVITIYIASAVVAQRKPMIGFIIALILLIIMQVLMFLGDPLSALKGILVRVIIGYFLIIAMIACSDYITTLRGLKAHGIDVEGSELV